MPALQGGHVTSRSPAGLRQGRARAHPWTGGGSVAFLEGPEPVAHASGCGALGASLQRCPSLGAAPVGDRRTGAPLCVLGGAFSLLLPIVRGPGEASALPWPPPTFAQLGAGLGLRLLPREVVLRGSWVSLLIQRAVNRQTLRTTLGEGRGVCPGGCDDKGWYHHFRPHVADVRVGDCESSRRVGGPGPASSPHPQSAGPRAVR